MGTPKLTPGAIGALVFGFGALSLLFRRNDSAAIDIDFSGDFMDIPFVKAKHFGHGRAGRRPDLLVIHTAECSESQGSALNVAKFFARGTVVASAHYVVDDNATVQCVLESDMAWHAPGVNAHSIGIEHAGFARQTPAEWADEYSKKELERSAQLSARLCVRYGISPRFVTAEELLQGKTGITGHVDVNRAAVLSRERGSLTSPFFNVRSTHWDPGPNFPWSSYLARVVELVKSGGNIA